MDNLNVMTGQNYPVSSETFDFMQNMILLTAKLTSLGGTNYIVSNCVKTGNNYAPGIVVVNGELMPFDGGAAYTEGQIDYVYVSETYDNVQVYDTVFQKARTKRILTRGKGVGYMNFTTFKQVPTLSALKTSIDAINNSLTSMNTTIGNKANTSALTALATIVADKASTASVNALTEVVAGKLTVMYVGCVTGYPWNTPSVAKISGTDDITFTIITDGDLHGKYKMVHNLNDSNYVVFGIGKPRYSAPYNFNCSPKSVEINNNYFTIYTSDDASGNWSDFYFMMLKTN